MNSYDVIVIGSGHNGLTTACYLAKSGHKVCVLERRETPGGAVCTEPMFETPEAPEGYRVDVGSSAHFMIHQTPVIRDLDLESYGLEYIEMDPFMSYPVPGGGVIHFHRSVEKTMESIAAVSPPDAAAYRDFIDFWKRINKRVLTTFLTPPAPGGLFREILAGQLRDGSMFGKGDQVDGIRKILSSYGQVVDEYFENESVKTALLWFAAQSGPPPDQTATADFVGWQAMLHESGGKRPKGGSGMLTQAMIRMLEAHGGEVRLNAPVDRILIRPDGISGRAVGVRLQSGEEIAARRVVSNAHVQTTMLSMVGPEHLSPALFKRVGDINVGNGFGMIIRCAVEELPVYDACPDDPLIHNGLQLLVPSREYMDASLGDFKAGRTPEHPSVLAMTFTKIDPSLAPEGRHLLYAWAQWHPWKLSGGRQWDDIREQEAQKIYDVVTRYAPNMKDKLIDWYIQAPPDIERKHGMPRGNVMHVEMTFDQMFLFRPTPELSRYKTPVKNLYLSSASCHPGGGVFAAAGYNAAHVILKDIRKEKRWFGWRRS
ncbi:NAD(P)/FAD-dependent oxidoreductase [Balneolales bacterium ANBcel1]|nr:NAD(P)/FAD-dependent oxidoreductase [Balneolales bacterium ANBcel1]